jgi:hypothetical protein
VIFPAKPAPKFRVQGSPLHQPALPDRIDQRVQMLPRLFEFWRRDAAQRAGSVLRLVVAPDEVPAGIAAPEGQTPKVCAVRVNLGAIGQTGLDFLLAAAAVETSIHWQFLGANILGNSSASPRISVFSAARFTALPSAPTISHA